MSRALVVSLISSLILALVGCGGTSGTGGNDGGGGSDAGTDSGGGGDGGGADASGDAANACSATEQCDGVIDDDCDGTVDEGCGRCPLMTISCPTGCCAVDRWEVDTLSANGTSIAVDDAGNIFFAYTHPNSGVWTSKLAIYDAVPGTWRSIALGGGTYRNRVRVDALGHVHVANALNDGNISYRRSDDHGVTFSAPVTVGVLNIGGTFDMAIDSAGRPHLAYAGDKQFSYSSDLHYTHLVGTTWVSELLDVNTGAQDHPTIAIGFADRPHIVYAAYNPPGSTGQAKRYVFHNGNRWVEETITAATPQQQYSGDDYFAAQSMNIAADDSREVLFTRKDSNVDGLYLARRGPADLDTWSITPLTGVTGFTTPTLVLDHHGKRAAVSEGLGLHREQTGAAWTSTPVGVPGTGVAVARRGRYLYLGYIAPSSSAPTITVVDLGP